ASLGVLITNDECQPATDVVRTNSLPHNTLCRRQSLFRSISLAHQSVHGCFSHGPGAAGLKPNAPLLVPGKPDARPVLLFQILSARARLEMLRFFRLRSV